MRQAVTLPGSWLEEYLETSGLGSRLAILAGRFPTRAANTQSALELSLEASSLFQRFQLPAVLEERILTSIDSIKGELLVRAIGPSCGASGLELWSARTRAALLDAIRAAWSRAYAPGALRVPSWPSVTVVERGTLPAAEIEQVDHWSERLSDGKNQTMTPHDLGLSLDAASAGTGGTNASAQLAEIGAYTRYALGRSYNGVLAPDDPFEFLELLASENTATKVLRERYLLLSGGDGDAYIKLAARSLALEQSLEPVTLPSHSPLRSSPDNVHAQQLIGSPSSPGRAIGLLRVPGATVAAQPSDVQGIVLVCERFQRAFLALKPVAVIESQDSRLGAGALLAKAAGLPCVSGVRDADAIPEGVKVRVDGWLGLVSVAVVD